MTRRQRVVGVLGVTAALVAGGCGSTVRNAQSSALQARSTGTSGDVGLDAPPGASQASGGSDTGTGTSTRGGGQSNNATRAEGGNAVGSTSAMANHSPISIGVLYAVNDGAESAGVNNGNNYTLKDAMHAVVDGYNAAGGIAGRRIDAVYAELHSASTDYESQTQAACSTFTQDHHVAAVLANVGYHSDILVSCLAKANVPLITGDWDAPDQSDAGKYPLFVTPTTVVGDARVAAVVQHLTSSGFLVPKNKVGVLVEDCPIDRRVYDNALVPALKRAGLTLAATFRPRCFQSLQSFGGQASDMQSAVLQFNGAGVDRIIVVSQAAEANMLALFSKAADAQGYRPGYALSSVAAPAVLALNAPASQLANMQGVGWLPAFDTQNLQQAPPTATGSRCLALLQKQGPRPASNVDYAYAYGPCDIFFLYDAALRATNGDATAAVVMRALAVVGRTYVSASTVDGRVGVDGGGRIGATAARLFAFTGGRFQYTSATFTL